MGQQQYSLYLSLWVEGARHDSEYRRLLDCKFRQLTLVRVLRPTNAAPGPCSVPIPDQ